MRWFWVSGLLSLTCLCFVGCAKYWYQEGKTFSQCKQDYRECHEEVKKYADMRKQHIGGHAEEFIEECMRQKKYRLVGAKKLPLRVKRQNPDTLYQATDRYGLAGLLDE